MCIDKHYINSSISQTSMDEGIDLVHKPNLVSKLIIFRSLLKRLYYAAVIIVIHTHWPISYNFIRKYYVDPFYLFLENLSGLVLETETYPNLNLD